MRDKEKARAPKNGPMALNTWENGQETKQMATGSYTMQTVTFTKGSGWMTKLTAMENILTIMALSMKVNGFPINNMALVSKYGLMGRNMKVILWKVQKKEEEF